jgi:hypothetical protein
VEELKQQVEDLMNFVTEVCAYYHITLQDKDEEQLFAKWVVARAGQLYIKYAILPKTNGPSC